MRPQAIMVAFSLLILGLIALVSMLQTSGVGTFATSPQVIEIPLGSRRIAGGGLGVITAIEATDERVVIGVACRSESRRVEARVGEPFDPVCGLEVIVAQILGYADDADEPQRLLLSILWDESPPNDPNRI